MIIDAKTKLDALLKTYPFLLEFLAGWSSKFEKLRNPLLRNTVGRLASLDQVAAMGDVPVDNLIAAIGQEIRRVTGESVTTEAGRIPGPAPALPTGRPARKS